MNNPLIRKIGATALGVLLLIYICYQVFIIDYNGISTETAMYAELSDPIQTTGWAIRNEELLTNAENGVLNYNVSDGEKVAVGDVIADIYTDEDSATNQNRILRLNAEINNLEVLKRAGDHYSSSADLIGAQINASLGEMLGLIRKNNYEMLYTEKDHFQYLMNQKRIIIGKESSASYQERIDELNAEKNSIASSGKIASINSPSSGYFISNTDGYENAFDVENIDKITIPDLENVQKSEISGTVIGKISKNFKWYIACTIDEQQKIKLEKISNVKIEIPLATVEQIPAEILAINKDEASGKYAVILQCNYMNAEIAAIRNETIQIVVENYSGVLVNQKAIHFNTITTETEDESGKITKEEHQNIKGVYVKFGDRINFVQIFSDVTINGYAVCKLTLSEEEEKLLVTDNTIQLYDEVVIGGTNLYDGKLL